MSLSNYRKVIFSLGQEISMENLHSLKYLLQDLLTTKEIEDFDTPTDLFVFLEQRNELGSENFHLLKDLLAQINRQDLVRKLEDFEKKKLAERDRVVNAETSSIGFRFVKKEHMLDSVTDGEPASSLSESDSEFEAAGSRDRRDRSQFESDDRAISRSRQSRVMKREGTELNCEGHPVMLRDISAEVYERLGFLLNPASCRNWIYLAGKLGYTYAQVSNYKLCPMQSTQMVLEDWATKADATVLKLYQTLKDIGRADAAKELEPILAPSHSTIV